MKATPDTAWRSAFGLSIQRWPGFLGSKDDLASHERSVPQAHMVRRAFDLLRLDGVLCDQSAPLVYFKRVRRIDPAEARNIHRLFWNHGGAPLLVLVAPDEVHVYSSLARPEGDETSGHTAGLVANIARTSAALREFLAAVESGGFFRTHAKSFDPANRVDRTLLDNLQMTRDKLADVDKRKPGSDVLDALLCRLVFTCYLFDRQVIGESYLRTQGLPTLEHLRDILALKPRTQAKAALYGLFEQLAKDFNGDLFSDDLRAEATLLSAAHLDVVEAFFSATDVGTGQRSFWPYDFGVIPIETISAIYERFLSSSAKDTGAFYTPRFLAELVLDLALDNFTSLLGRRFLDPACGSGIFLVGLFNRMAEEWTKANPGARNVRRSRDLLDILRFNIAGVDVNPTACRITAFSLYLAYLDQLTPRDIQELQAKGGALPRLVRRANQPNGSTPSGGIWCGDFFDESANYPSDVDLVVGNPPWGSLAGKGSAAAAWCERHHRSIPDKQIATAFMWKAVDHAAPNARVCLVLPHGILFNHRQPAISFQKAFIEHFALDRVLNLTDYQSFLFDEARHPALVLSYRGTKPSKQHTTAYWAPKVDWKATNAELITITERDRTMIRTTSILENLTSDDAPDIWKRMSWASSRDRRLLDRLSQLPRLGDRVRQAGDRSTDKPWLIAEGFQPIGAKDDAARGSTIRLPSKLFIEASSPALQLFLVEADCTSLSSPSVRVRNRSNKGTAAFQAPHVLVAKGFGSIAFADFDVSFRHALRGIHGPSTDQKLLMFLAAYLRSSLARYFLFHTSSNWGVSRQEVHVEELLRLPFPTPDAAGMTTRGKHIIEDVSRLVHSASRDARQFLSGRESLVSNAHTQIELLIQEYFDILPTERILLDDTARLLIPSFRPSRRRATPSMQSTTNGEQAQYVKRLCDTLNAWTGRGKDRVAGSVAASAGAGIGLVILERTDEGRSSAPEPPTTDVLSALERLQDAASSKVNTVQLMRGVKVFEGRRLYIIKPLDRRHWTETAALNDADEIAGSLLMHRAERNA